MRKRPFLVFIAVVGMMIWAVVAFIQSARFATVVKQVIAQYLPRDLGVEGDFSGLSIKLFPPGISVNDPKILIRKRNLIDLPTGSRVTAQRIDLAFLPFQMLSGNIRINKVTIVGGDVQLAFDKDYLASKTPKRPSSRFSWNDLLKVRADAVALEDTHVHLSLAEPALTLDMLAKEVSVGQWLGGGGVGYELSLALSEVNGTFPKAWRIHGPIQKVSLRGRINALGLQIDDLTAISDDLELRTSGGIKGDFLNPTSLRVETDVDIRSSLKKLIEVNTGEDLPEDGQDLANPVRGSVRFRGKMRGQLDKFAETLRADGRLFGEDIQFHGWKADRIQAEGNWTSGEVSINRISVQEPFTERQGHTRSALGGKVEIGAFKFKPGSKEPLNFPLKLEEAHIQWLTGPAAKKIHGLLLRVNGSAEVKLSLNGQAGHRWEVHATHDFKVKGFQLDNQKYGVPRPLKKILAIPEIWLAGSLSVDADGIHLESEQLTTPSKRTHFQVNGDIDFEEGFDFAAEGPVNLEDVGQIAETDIRGEGTLHTHVHGPASKLFIDFDADLTKASYLKLAFGDFRGRITWDDDAHRIVFTDVSALQGATPYRAEGVVDAGPAESIALDIQFAKGRIQDLNAIFDHLTQPLSWYPRALNGEMAGKVKISGGISLDKLVVAGDLSGPNWEYYGERIKHVSLKGGYDRGKYQLESLNLQKQNGQVLGHISYDSHHSFDWEFHTENLTVSDLDHLARLDVPVRGAIRVASRGVGREGAIESVTQVAVTETAVRGVALPKSDLTIRSTAGVTSLAGVGLGGQGSVEGSFNSNPGTMSYLRGTLRDLDFSSILLLLNPKSIQDPELMGKASGTVNLEFKSGEIDQASGRIDITSYRLAKTGARFELTKPVSVKIDRGTFNLNELSLSGNQGEVLVSLRGRNAELEGSVTGALDASIVEFVTSSISKASGTAVLDFNIGGSLKEPTVFGKATLGGLTLRVPSLESPIENVTGTLFVKQMLITAERIEGELANGHVTAGGTVQLFTDKLPALELKANLSGSRLKLPPFQYVKVRGQMRVHGTDLPYLIDGTLIVDSALIKQNVMSAGGGGQGLKTARYTPPPTSRQESDYPKFKLNLAVEAPSGILIQNDLFDAEARGHVTVINTPEVPRIIGAAELIQGKMNFKDRSFQIQAASMKFDNPTVINPAFTLTGVTDVSGTKIQLDASGKLDNYKIELSSNPVLPEAEILNLLAVGYTTDEMKRLKTSDRSAFEQSEAASLLLHALDVNQDVQSKTGFQIQLDESVNNQTGTSAFSRARDTETAAGPKIVIKRRIGKNVDVSVGSTVGVGSSSQKEVNTEYHVTPGFSVNGVWDRIEGEGLEVQQRDSYGIDLKLQKRFK